MKQYQRNRLENKYCYGSHSIQARINVQLLGERALGRGCNNLVNQRIAKRLCRLNKEI